MSAKESVEQITEKLLQPILSEHHFELVDVEFVKEAGSRYLRIYIDKENGITIDDCETVSRALDVKLDEQDPIKEEYILEVSSPGLDRPLKKEKDFVRSVSKLIEIKLYKPTHGSKEFMGTLKAYDQETVTIEVENNLLTFNRKEIALIRLAVIF